MYYYNSNEMSDYDPETDSKGLEQQESQNYIYTNTLPVLLVLMTHDNAFADAYKDSTSFHIATKPGNKKGTKHITHW